MNANQTIYFATLNFDEKTLYLAATDNGLCYVGAWDHDFEDLEMWVKKHYPSSQMKENPQSMASYMDELLWYFQGKRPSFSVPIEMTGTPFQQMVWSVLKDIPYGETITYSDVAGRIGNPKAVRAVGTAIGANPLLVVVPCHRVVGKNGQLTGYRGGLVMKEKLLELESL